MPSYYKTASIADGKLSFGTINGTVTAIGADKVTTKFKTNTKYGDYQLNLDGIRDAMGLSDEDVVYGVVVCTDDGTDYAMRHVENIWRTEELAWSVGIVTETHGCPLSSEHYKSMVGKTINQVTYYTSNGIFTLPVNYKVFEHAVDAAATVENAKVTAGQTELTVSLPTDFDAEYTFTDAKENKIEGFEIKEETAATAGVAILAAEINNVEKKLVITYPATLANTAYTLTISDKSEKYAPVTTAFELYAESIPAKYNNDVDAPKLVMADGATAAQFADYIGKITSVNVNGKDYAASGRGAVTIINADGTIDTTAAPFVDGSSFEIKVSATGYEDGLTFTYVKPVVIDTAALESVIAKAETLKEVDYTVESWKTFSNMLASAKEVLEQKDDQAKVDTATESLNKAIESLKKKDSSSNPSGGQQGGSGIGTGSGSTGTGNGTGTTVSNGNNKTNTNANTAKNTTVKKATKTGDTNPLWSMTVVAFAAICLIAAGLFRRKSVRK